MGYNRCVDCTHVGFELWQVSAGTIFDNIIVTDSVEEAQAFAEDTYFKNKDGERAMQEEQQKHRQKQGETMMMISMMMKTSMRWVMSSRFFTYETFCNLVFPKINAVYFIDNSV